MALLLPFFLGEERYALKLTDVQEIIEETEIHYLPAAPPSFLGAVNVHGRILPVLALDQLLGFEAGESDERLIVLAGRELPLVLAVQQLERLLNVDLEQAGLNRSEAPDDCISAVLNWHGQMISLLDLAQLKKFVEEECLLTGGGHAATRADR